MAGQASDSETDSDMPGLVCMYSGESGQEAPTEGDTSDPEGQDTDVPENIREDARLQDQRQGGGNNSGFENNNWDRLDRVIQAQNHIHLAFQDRLATQCQNRIPCESGNSQVQVQDFQVQNDSIVVIRAIMPRSLLHLMFDKALPFVVLTFRRPPTLACALQPQPGPGYIP